MEDVYVEATINDRLIRINKNDSMDVYIWRDYYIKTPKWVKKKPSLTIDKKTKYEKYIMGINGKTCRLSRVVYKAHNPDWDITDTSDTNFIDHINNNSLDNRIENLRILTHQQNQFNSKAKGYSWHKQRKKYVATIKLNYVDIHLGLFAEEEDARNAYLEAKEKYHNIIA